MWTLLISCLIHSLLDKVEKNQKPIFFKLRVIPVFCKLIILILNGAQNFKFIGFIFATLVG